MKTQHPEDLSTDLINLQHKAANLTSMLKGISGLFRTDRAGSVPCDDGQFNGIGDLLGSLTDESEEIDQKLDEIALSLK